MDFQNITKPKYCYTNNGNSSNAKLQNYGGKLYLILHYCFLTCCTFWTCGTRREKKPLILDCKFL